MRIGIDARPLTEFKAGIGYYLSSLLTNILNNDEINEYVLFSDREIFFDRGNYKNVQFIQDNSIIKKTPWYIFKLPRLLKKNHIDVFWGTQHVLPNFLNKKIKTLLTIHDLVCYEFPETMHSYNKWVNKIFIPISIKKAHSIVSVSNSTKDQIIKYFPDKSIEKKISVIYESSEKNMISCKEKEGFFNNYNEIEPQKYILYLGTLEPRKGIDTLLKAFEIIAEKSDLKLVLCGKVGWKAEGIINSIKENHYNERILYLDYVTDLEKNILYADCFAFVFPSLYEGFGLPVVEAMKSDSLVIVSKTSSLDELVEEDSLKFNSKDSLDLAHKVLNIYNDKDKYAELRAYCIKRGKDFDWDIFSKEYIKLLEGMIL